VESGITIEETVDGFFDSGVRNVVKIGDDFLERFMN